MLVGVYRLLIISVCSVQGSSTVEVAW